MIALWMLYCVGVGLAFAVVGFALDKGLHYAGLPTRWAWVIALAGSYAVPVAAWLRPPALAAPLAVESATHSSNITTAPNATILRQAPQRSLALGDLDQPLRWAWMLASLVLVVSIGVGATRLVLLRRGWRRAHIDGRDVLISPKFGPAVVGVWIPRIVLPDWVLQLPPHERELVFAHEEQHMRAADPILNALAFSLLALAPWNPALWWQWRRLRLAVEGDCDARVLRQGCSMAAYGDLLLRVGTKRRAQLLRVAAFGEPVSFLEFRIRRMIARVPRWRWAGVGAAVVVATVAIVGACEAPRPFVPAALAQEPASPMTRQQAAWVRENVRQFFPTLGDSNGPPLAAYLIHDARLHVYQATLTQRIRDAITTADVRRVFPAYDSGHDDWTMVDPATLQGIVRNNVRVIPIHHDPQPQDTMPSLRALLEEPQPDAMRLEPNGALSLLHADDSVVRQLEDRLEQLRWQQRDETLRELARRSEPAAFESHIAIALIIDSENRLLAHASGTQAPGRASCVDVLTQLLPAYRATRFEISGCMITEPRKGGVVYWGQIKP